MVCCVTEVSLFRQKAKATITVLIWKNDSKTVLDNRIDYYRASHTLRPSIFSGSLVSSLKSADSAHNEYIGLG